jgi:hypothetical protein
MLVRFVGRDHPRPWNKGLLVGQKKPLQPKHVWSIRVRLEIAHMWRDLALFNLAIDSKLRACDWSNFASTKYAQVQWSGTERQSSKRRRADQCSSRLRSRRGPPSKSGYEFSARLVPDISSRADFMHALTYSPDNIPGWCIAGLIASI